MWLMIMINWSRGSHLPHLLASALAKRVLDPSPGVAEQLCATGFRDNTTGSAAGNVARHCPVQPRSHPAVIDEYSLNDRLRQLVSEDSSEAIEGWLDEAKRARDEWRTPDAD